MVKKSMTGMIVYVLALTIAVIGGSLNLAVAQETRSIVPYPRDNITIEAIDPETKLPRSSFCIGPNMIDVRLTNNGEYRRYVYVVNRDTRGTERTLYNGWLEPGQHYLSTLIQAQLELAGPAGIEGLRVDISEYGRIIPGTWMTFYVQECGGGYPPGGGYGANVWARISPYAIAQGKKGTITLQTNVGSQTRASYYFEVLNSWDQLWKRLPVNKRPYERYQMTLSVGKNTKPGMLTYTVNLWYESGMGGERRKVATTKFSFRVVTPGSTPAPYDPGYPTPGSPYDPGYPTPGSPYDPGYSWPQQPWNPYGGGMPYPGNPYNPYTIPPYGTYPYGAENYERSFVD